MDMHHQRHFGTCGTTPLPAQLVSQHGVDLREAFQREDSPFKVCVVHVIQWLDGRRRDAGRPFTLECGRPTPSQTGPAHRRCKPATRPSERSSRRSSPPRARSCCCGWCVRRHGRLCVSACVRARLCALSRLKIHSIPFVLYETGRPRGGRAAAGALGQHAPVLPPQGAAHPADAGETWGERTGCVCVCVRMCVW